MRPFLDVANPAGEPVGANLFTLPVIATGGTLVLLAGLVTVGALGVRPRDAAREWTGTVHELRYAILTVTSVLVLAYVMNLSGQAATIGQFVAVAGAGLAFLSPAPGWFASPSRAPTPPRTPSSARSRSRRPTNRACHRNCSPRPTAPAGYSAR